MNGRRDDKDLLTAQQPSTIRSRQGRGVRFNDDAEVDDERMISSASLTVSAIFIMRNSASLSSFARSLADSW